MKIIIVGVSCVGKSTVGKILAEKVGYRYFDFDLEVQKHFNKPIQFIKNEFLSEHSYRDKVKVVLNKILNENEDNFIIAMPPSGLMDNYWKIIKKDETIITIALKDKAKNILKRIEFYDDYSNLIEYEITPSREIYYLKEIRDDIEYFGRSYVRAKFQYNINGEDALQVADGIHRRLF